MRTAHDHFQRCIDLCEQHGFTGLRLSYLPMLAVTHTYLLQFQSTRSLCEKTTSDAKRAGDLRAELLASTVLASLECFGAQYPAALERSGHCVALARELRTPRFEAECLLLQGLALLGIDEREDAESTLQRAVALARAAASTYCGPMTLAALAAATDDAARCRALLDEGEEQLAAGALSHNHFEFRLQAVDVCLRLGDTASVLRHAEALEKYTRAEPLPWSTLVIERARVLANLRNERLGQPTASRIDELLRLAERVGFAQLVPALQEASASLQRRSPRR
jgi:hypothetical protein